MITLTPRETEALYHIANGKGHRETAGIMGICVKTVQKHAQNVLYKLGTNNQIIASHYALAVGLVKNHWAERLKK